MICRFSLVDGLPSFDLMIFSKGALIRVSGVRISWVIKVKNCIFASHRQADCSLQNYNKQVLVYTVFFLQFGLFIIVEEDYANTNNHDIDKKCPSGSPEGRRDNDL